MRKPAWNRLISENVLRDDFENYAERCLNNGLSVFFFRTKWFDVLFGNRRGAASSRLSTQAWGIYIYIYIHTYMIEENCWLILLGASPETLQTCNLDLFQTPRNAISSRGHNRFGIYLRWCLPQWRLVLIKTWFYCWFLLLLNCFTIQPTQWTNN